MKTVWLVTIVACVLLMTATSEAGSLQDRLFGVLGIEPAATTEIRGAALSESESAITAWLLGTPTEMDNPDAEISLRLGWLSDDVEFGAQFDAIGIHGENDESFGVYAIMHLDAEGILGSTYFGYAAGIQDVRSYGPIIGTILEGIAVEYRYRDFSSDSPLGNATDRHQVYVGLPWKF